MVRRAISIFVGLATIAAIVWYSGNHAAGQGYSSTPVTSAGVATPAAITEAVDQLPVDFEVALRASAELSGLDATGLELRLERIALISGDHITHQATDNELFYVEIGSVSVEVRNKSATLETGAEISFAPGDDYAIEPTSTRGATLLKVSLGAKNTGASPAATPITEPAPELLFSGDAGRLRSSHGTLYLVNVVIPSGSSTGEQSLSGPTGINVETGAIVLHDTSLPDVEIETGHSAFVPGYTTFNAANTGDSDAVILVAGLLAPPVGAAVGPTSTPTPAVDELATVHAEATELAENLAILTTREADLSKTVTALQTSISDVEASGTAIAATLTSVSNEAQSDATAAAENQAAAQDEIAALEATQTSLASAVASAGKDQSDLAATVTALSEELDSAYATATDVGSQVASAADAASTEIGSLESTVVALQTSEAEGKSEQATTTALLQTSEAESQSVSQDLASAQATIETQSTAIAASDATIESQSTEIANAAGTADSQSTEIANVEGTAESQSSEIANAEATISSQAGSIGTADANVGALSSEVANANATISAQAGAAETAEAVNEASQAAVQGTADAYATALNTANATSTAVAAAANQSATAHASEIGALDATISVQQTAASNSQSILATSAVDATSAEATIIALQTALAANANVAVSSLNPQYVQLTIQVNLDAVVAGDATAIEEAKTALAIVLTPYSSCRAGVVLSFGHGVTIGQGVRLAAAINEIIQAEYPEIFDGAAFDAFGDLSPQLGQVDIRIYFFTGCEPAAS